MVGEFAEFGEEERMALIEEEEVEAEKIWTGCGGGK